jgi:hypothetical protein
VRFSVSQYVAPHLPILFVSLSLVEVCIALTEAVEKIYGVAEGNVPYVLLPLHRVLHRFATQHAASAQGTQSTLDSSIFSVNFILWFSAASILVVVFMAWHHHQITHRITRHQVFLSSLREVAEKATRLVVSPAEPAAANHFIEATALHTLTSSLVTDSSVSRFRRARNKPTLVATVLETDTHENCFRLKHQWPSGIYAFPVGGLPYRCAAGRALDLKRLIYVPRTYFSHGIQLWPKDDGTNSKAYTNLDLAEGAFVQLPSSPSTFIPNSTISFVIPVPESSKSYVLCLDSDRSNHFRLMDFEAVRLIGSLLGVVLSDLAGDSSSSSDVSVPAAPAPK